jgi:hypothetical protein
MSTRRGPEMKSPAETGRLVHVVDKTNAARS